jgi:hypothetical protein
MTGETTTARLIAWSVTLYRTLLAAYPSRFRQEYGAHMVQVFQDCCFQALRNRGVRGVLRLWIVTLIDLVRSAIAEHAHKEIQVNKPMDTEEIWMGGWALIWAGVVLAGGHIAFFMGNPDLWMISGLLILFVGLPLLTAGVLALRKRYGQQVGAFGSDALLLGTILAGLSVFLALFTRYEWSWLAGLVSPAFPLFGLALFGVAALFRKPLPRWNALPLLAGLWNISLYALYVHLPGAIDWAAVAQEPLFKVASDLAFAIHGIALVALGNILISDVPGHAPAPV